MWMLEAAFPLFAQQQTQAPASNDQSNEVPFRLGGNPPIERWTRVDFATLTNQVTIDDPGVYSKPFTVNFTARLSKPGDELMEYVCLENNQFGAAGGHVNPYTGK